MKVNELLQHWKRFSDNDLVNAYVDNNGEREVIATRYKELKYSDLQKYLDHDVDAFYETHYDYANTDKKEEISVLNIIVSCKGE